MTNATPSARRKQDAVGTRRSLRRALLLFCWLVLVSAAAAAYPVLVRGHALSSARWEAPLMLLGLLLVPLVLYRGTLGEDARVPRLRLGTLQPLMTGPLGWRVWIRDLPGVLRATALVLFVLAMAQPVDTLRPQTADEEGIDVVLVLDLSGSMQAVMENLPPVLSRYVQHRHRRVRKRGLRALAANAGLSPTRRAGLEYAPQAHRRQRHRDRRCHRRRSGEAQAQHCKEQGRGAVH
jgi:hypothetical protein